MSYKKDHKQQEKAIIFQIFEITRRAMGVATTILALILLHAAVQLVAATNVHVVNQCGRTVCAKYWAPTNGVGGGCRELQAGQAWDVGTSPAWQAATLWAVVGSCAGQACNTGPPTGVTQFEFTVGGFSNTDYYDVSIKAGFNLGMTVGPTNAACPTQDCRVHDRCDGFTPTSPDRTKSCPFGSTDYVVTFY